MKLAQLNTDNAKALILTSVLALVFNLIIEISQDQAGLLMLAILLTYGLMSQGDIQWNK